MDNLKAFFQWFAGGSDHHYHRLFNCMGHDTFWAVTTVVLDLTVAAGYAVIAYHWWDNQRRSPNTPAKAALRNMRNIFILCAACGYIFIPLKMVWPAWRLYDIVIVFLVYYTWRYAWGAKGLKVIYNELGHSHLLKTELEKSQWESRQKSFFLNALSHDLRTPLNGILLQAQVARVCDDDPQATRQALKEIETGAKAVADLLDTLLQCARLDWVEDPVQNSRFTLSTVLESAVVGCAMEADKKGVLLRIECPPDLVLDADKVKIERVIANLAGNAVKFTEKGYVRIGVQAAKGGIEIDVIDTGPGLTPEQQEKVFDEFYQVKNNERDRTKGFGLGLAIARRMARQLGGDIELESALGAGCRFSLLLPGAVKVAQPRSEEPNRRPREIVGVAD